MGLKPTARQLRLRAFYGIRGLALHRLNHAAVHFGAGAGVAPCGPSL